MHVSSAWKLLILPLGVVLGVSTDSTPATSDTLKTVVPKNAPATRNALLPRETNPPAPTKAQNKCKKRDGTREEIYTQMYHPDDDYGKWASDPDLGRGPHYSRTLRDTLYRNPCQNLLDNGVGLGKVWRADEDGFIRDQTDTLKNLTDFEKQKLGLMPKKNRRLPPRPGNADDPTVLADPPAKVHPPGESHSSVPKDVTDRMKAAIERLKKAKAKENIVTVDGKIISIIPPTTASTLAEPTPSFVTKDGVRISLIGPSATNTPGKKPPSVLEMLIDKVASMEANFTATATPSVDTVVDGTTSSIGGSSETATPAVEPSIVTHDGVLISLIPSETIVEAPTGLAIVWEKLNSIEADEMMSATAPLVDTVDVITSTVNPTSPVSTLTASTESAQDGSTVSSSSAAVASLSARSHPRAWPPDLSESDLIRFDPYYEKPHLLVRATQFGPIGPVPLRAIVPLEPVIMGNIPHLRWPVRDPIDPTRIRYYPYDPWNEGPGGRPPLLNRWGRNGNPYDRFGKGPFEGKGDRLGPKPPTQPQALTNPGGKAANDAARAAEKKAAELAAQKAAKDLNAVKPVQRQSFASKLAQAAWRGIKSLATPFKTAARYVQQIANSAGTKIGRMFLSKAVEETVKESAVAASELGLDGAADAAIVVGSEAAAEVVIADAAAAAAAEAAGAAAAGAAGGAAAGAAGAAAEEAAGGAAGSVAGGAATQAMMDGILPQFDGLVEGFVSRAAGAYFVAQLSEDFSSGLLTAEQVAEKAAAAGSYFGATTAEIDAAIAAEAALIAENGAANAAAAAAGAGVAMTSIPGSEVALGAMTEATLEAAAGAAAAEAAGGTVASEVIGEGLAVGVSEAAGAGIGMTVGAEVGEAAVGAIVAEGAALAPLQIIPVIGQVVMAVVFFVTILATLLQLLLHSNKHPKNPGGALHWGFDWDGRPYQWDNKLSGKVHELGEQRPEPTPPPTGCDTFDMDRLKLRGWTTTQYAKHPCPTWVPIECTMEWYHDQRQKYMPKETQPNKNGEWPASRHNPIYCFEDWGGQPDKKQKKNHGAVQTAYNAALNHSQIAPHSQYAGHELADHEECLGRTKKNELAIIKSPRCYHKYMDKMKSHNIENKDCKENCEAMEDKWKWKTSGWPKGCKKNEQGCWKRWLPERLFGMEVGSVVESALMSNITMEATPTRVQ